LDLQEIVWGIEWIDLAQDRSKWLAFMHMVLNLGVLKNAKFAWPAGELLAS
jgi:hypothetical protein